MYEAIATKIQVTQEMDHGFVFKRGRLDLVQQR